VKARRDLAGRLLQRTRTTVRYLVGSHPDAEDLIQQSLLEILGAAGTFRGDSRLETWADRITVFTTLKALGRLGKRVDIAREDAGERTPSNLSPEKDVAKRQLCARLAGMLQRLPPERRTVVTLSMVHDYSLADIAAMTGAPFNTVRDRLRVGRKQLRAQLARDELFSDWAKRGKKRPT
jgi:RNA polymerase sigma-70 factor (ECF subfamily)